MRKFAVTAAILSIAVEGLAFAPARAQASDLTEHCPSPAPRDKGAFAALQHCLKALDARAAALDSNIAQSAGDARVGFEDEKQLTSFALAAVKTYADAVAALRANLDRQKAVSDRIVSLNTLSDQADDRRKAALAAVRQDEEAKLGALRLEEKSLGEKAEKARPPAANYLAALSSFQIELTADAPSARTASAACAQMVEDPQPALDVSECAAAAIGSFAGGEVRVPGSFLNPRGFSALLSGSETGGTLSITYAAEFKRRRPLATEIAAQSFSRPGFSLGVSTGGGALFKSDESKDFIDRFDGKLTVTGGLFLNFYDPQPRQNWRIEADGLSADAIMACFEDQAKPVPSFRSSCSGQSLTDWVYAAKKDKHALMHAELAQRTNALYFGPKDLAPRWGFGVEGSIARPSAEYLREDGFTTSFKGKFDEAFEDAALVKDRKIAWSVTPYAFWRFGSEQSKVQTVAAASFSIARQFGFDDDAEKTLFCPAIDTSKPFSLGDCKSYFALEPTDRMVYTPAGELRFLFGGDGWRPTVSISPKLSYAFGKETPSGNPDRWTLSIPALVFVDDQLKTGLGLKLDYSWGGTELDSATAQLVDRSSETAVSLVVSKTFSLTGMK